MEQARKNLKLISLCILVLFLASLALTVFGLVTEDFSEVENEEGVTEELVKIVFYVAGALSLLFSLPRLYVALKGLSIAKAPKEGKAHVTWATVLLVFAVISIFSGISDLSKADAELSGVLGVVLSLAETALYFFYVKSAKRIQSELE